MTLLLALAAPAFALDKNQAAAPAAGGATPVVAPPPAGTGTATPAAPGSCLAVIKGLANRATPARWTKTEAETPCEGTSGPTTAMKYGGLVTDQIKPYHCGVVGQVFAIDTFQCAADGAERNAVVRNAWAMANLPNQVAELGASDWCKDVVLGHDLPKGYVGAQEVDGHVYWGKTDADPTTRHDCGVYGIIPNLAGIRDDLAVTTATATRAEGKADQANVDLVTLTGVVTTLTGVVQTSAGNIDTLTGEVAQAQVDAATAQGTADSAGADVRAVAAEVAADEKVRIGGGVGVFSTFGHTGPVVNGVVEVEWAGKVGARVEVFGGALTEGTSAIGGRAEVFVPAGNFLFGGGAFAGNFAVGMLAGDGNPSEQNTGFGAALFGAYDIANSGFRVLGGVDGYQAIHKTADEAGVKMLPAFHLGIEVVPHRKGKFTLPSAVPTAPAAAPTPAPA